MTWLLRNVMADLVPRSPGLPGLVDCEPDVFLQKLRAETTLLTWIGLCAGAVLWLITPLLTIGVPLPALLLSEDQRDRHINALASTNIYLLRQAFFLLKMYACMCWGQHAAVRSRFKIAAYPVDPGTFRTS